MSVYDEECKGCRSKCYTLSPSAKIGKTEVECPCLWCIVKMVCTSHFDCSIYHEYIQIYYDPKILTKESDK